MRSAYDYFVLFSYIVFYMYKYGAPILIGVGTLSCALSVMVFTKKHLRKNPCSTYLIAYNLCSFLFIAIPFLISTLIGGFNIDPTITNLAICRLSLYTLFVFGVLGPCYLILASIDRVLITSRNALTRQRSTPCLAYTLIVIVTLFWFLFHIHVLILGQITFIIPNKKVCYFQGGIYTTFITYYLLVVRGILIPVIMVIVGLLAVKNVRGISQVQPISTPANTEPATFKVLRSSQSKDRQLLRMLLFDVIIYVFFNIITPAVMIRQQLPQNSADLTETVVLAFLSSVGVYASCIPPCIGFYVKLVISKTFREEVKKLLICQ